MVKKKSCPWPLPSKLDHAVRRFTQSLQHQGWKLSVFIDNSIATHETLQTWKARREKEVKNQSKNVPQGCSLLLSDAFKRYDVPVHHSFNADNDDTIIAFATHQVLHTHQDIIAILSADRDMFRYENLASHIQIYKSFSYKRGQIVLERQTGTHRKSHTSPRQILPRVPATLSHPAFADVVTHSLYLCGSPSPLTRRFGNLHIAIQDFRQALWKLLNFNQSITFECPIWNENLQHCEWHKSQIVIGADYRIDPNLEQVIIKNLSTNPLAIVQYVFQKELSSTLKEDMTRIQLSNHIYAMHMLVFELISMSFAEYRRSNPDQTHASSIFAGPSMSALDMLEKFYKRN